MSKIKFIRVTALPETPESGAVYFIPNGLDKTKAYVVDNNGAYRQVGPDAVPNINGGVFISNVEAQSEIETIRDIVWASENENNQLIGFTTTTKNITVAVSAISGHTHFKPVIKYVDSELSEHVISLNKTLDIWYGEINIILADSQESINFVHEDGAYTSADITFESKPEILSAKFVDTPYPVGQTELKADDSTQITVSSDREIHRVVIENDNTFAIQPIDVNIAIPATELTLDVLARDCGDIASDKGFSITVYDANGIGSELFISENVVTVNNVSPTIMLSVLSYTSTQLALGDVNDTATISTLIGNEGASPTYQYGTPNDELSIVTPTEYAAQKLVTLIESTPLYNITNNNLSLTVVRAENGASSIQYLNVKIASLAPEITISIDGITGEKRLRSGGNDGTLVQQYLVRLTSNQQLQSIPTMGDLTVDMGVWAQTIFSVNGTNSWTRIINVSDSHSKGAATLPLIYAKNLAGKEVTDVVGGATSRNYVLAGFVSRTLNLPPSLSTPEVSFSVETFNWNNVKMLWSYKTMNLTPSPIETEPPQTGGWIVSTGNANPTIIEILDLASYGAISGQTTTVTIEEII